MKAVLYKMPDGHVERLWLSPEMFNADSPTRALLRTRGIDFTTDADVLDWIIAKDVPADATRVTVVDESELPSRSNREALALVLK